ncbi:FmdB family zinc ribbon protein [Rubripirellula reticaptiva]|uniref:Zinc ribbon domain protein n=1 Tax=Rubripirellula reticaptiva TaxID=2528013 RepID=A0A5C6EKU8_9BACT|nr:zinc ribbon domain-containing protein [Rubripirellula reticaptiva]TWU49762.1 Zinc ribbon domain protein [Rubripirellula reticaptiva]
MGDHSPSYRSTRGMLQNVDPFQVPFMPLYEYECKSCDQVIEILVSTPSADVIPNDAQCPGCGSGQFQRVFSVTASPTVKSGAASESLPIAGGGGSCGAPRCCGGSC